MEYDVINYDVLGNPKDGYEVNDAHYTGLTITVNDDDTDADVIKALQNVGFLKDGLHRSKFEVDGDPDYTLYVNATHSRYGGLYPLCELQAKAKGGQN